VRADASPHCTPTLAGMPPCLLYIRGVINTPPSVGRRAHDRHGRGSTLRHNETRARPALGEVTVASQCRDMNRELDAYSRCVRGRCVKETRPTELAHARRRMTVGRRPAEPERGSRLGRASRRAGSALPDARATPRRPTPALAFYPQAHAPQFKGSSRMGHAARRAAETRLEMVMPGGVSMDAGTRRPRLLRAASHTSYSDSIGAQTRALPGLL
jgi:hypothetical protein